MQAEGQIQSAVENSRVAGRREALKQIRFVLQILQTACEQLRRIFAGALFTNNSPDIHIAGGSDLELGGISGWRTASTVFQPNFFETDVDVFNGDAASTETLAFK